MIMAPPTLTRCRITILDSPVFQRRPQDGFLYWTQKGKPKGNEGRILRAALNVAPGMEPGHRTDIEVLFDGLPEPIDLEWEGETGMLYWTDRGDPPNGNTLNRAKIRDSKADDHEIILSGLKDGEAAHSVSREFSGLLIEPIDEFATCLSAPLLLVHGLR
jgi:hypothetical protein